MTVEEISSVTAHEIGNSSVPASRWGYRSDRAYASGESVSQTLLRPPYEE